MKLKEIATISGKPGLYKIFKPTKNGVIVESLDDKKQKMVVGSNHRVSILQEVSIYTTDKEGSKPLAEVLHKITQEYKDGLSLNAKSSNQELEDFMLKIVPEYDKTKVYVSDMKKLVGWYGILQKYSPETFATLLEVDEPKTETVEEAIAETQSETVEETKTTKKSAIKSEATAKEEEKAPKKTKETKKEDSEKPKKAPKKKE
jgi:outer membrane biosynthesis protein TonB